MNQLLDDLIKVMTLERLEINLFRGQSRDIGSPQVFGGQVLGQTPLVLARPPGGALKLRMEKDGYLPNTHSVSLDEDSTIELTLEHKPRPHIHRTPREAPADAEPAKL